MRNDNITKLTLAGMFAALAFVCFTYLRIEIPMGGGMTGKIYIAMRLSFYRPWCWGLNTVPLPALSACL